MGRNFQEQLEYKLVPCDCTASHHAWYLVYDPGDGKDWHHEFYLHTQLIQYRGFWKRLITAVRYLFKRKEPYGHWDCSLMSVNQAQELANWLDAKLAMARNERALGALPELDDDCCHYGK